MTDLAGEVARVAGSTRGIGRAVAQRHARFRTSVVVRYSMCRDMAERTVTGIAAVEGRAVAERADLWSSAGLTRSFASAIDVCARLDIVIVASAPRKAFERSVDITEYQFDDLFVVNSNGAFASLQQAAKGLFEGGRVIDISSSTKVSRTRVSDCTP